MRQQSRPAVAERWYRPIMLGLVGGLVLFLIGRAVTWDWAGAAQLTAFADHHIYMEAAARIRSGGPFYPAFQLAGPYTLDRNPELYPPYAIVLLILPMSFLPDVLWWLIPLGIIAGVVAYHRPSAAGWALILAMFIPPWSWDGIAAGGVFMWIAAFVALGTVWPTFFLGALLKPSLFPFALLGIRDKRWWIGLAIPAAVTLALLPQSIDYLRALANLQGGSLLYSVHNVPLILVPLIAHLGAGHAGRLSARLPRRIAPGLAGSGSGQ